MSNLKRFLALTLSIIMIVSGLATLSVSAVRPTDVTDTFLAYTIDTLNKLGVIKGVSDKEFVFAPDDNVTREQFALFTARISTALPELFEVNTLALDTPDLNIADNKPFEDLKDPTYFTAINHLASEQIVVGVGDGKFNPSGNVTLQDAVTMLVRSLRYTGLIYPTGFMVKANEIGLIGQGAVDRGGFMVDDVKPNEPITRAIMAKLLWNYLLNYRLEVTMAYNPGKNQWEPNTKQISILSLFGFSTVDGYVTGTEGWAVNLALANGELAIGQALYPVANSITTANQANIEITPINVSDDNKITFSNAKIKTTKAAIGITDPKYTDEYLLGLKVQIFKDNRKNPVSQINIPTRIVGTKTVVHDVVKDGKLVKDSNGNDSDYTVKDGKVQTVNSYTLGTDADPVTYIQSTSGTSDLNAWNVYTFDRNDPVMKDARSGDCLSEDNSMKELAKTVKASNAAYYMLEYVNNGTTVDVNGYDVSDFYYVFRPVKVGYYAGNAAGWNDPDGWNGLGYSAGGGWVQFASANSNDYGMSGPGDWESAGQLNNKYPKPDEIKKANPEMADDFKPGEAYLYTAYGKQVHIFSKLAAYRGALTNFVTNNSVRFTDSATFPTITINDLTGIKANGARTFALDATKGEGSVYANRKYDYFADELGGNVLLMRYLNPGQDAFVGSKYVIALSFATATDLIYNGTVYPTAVRASVYDTTDNTAKIIYITKIDGADATATLPYVGMPIRLVSDNDGNVIWKNTSTPFDGTNKAFVNDSSNYKDGVREYYFTNMGWTPAGNFDATRSAINADLLKGGAKGLNGADATNNYISAVLRSTSKIYVVNNLTGKVTQTSVAQLNANDAWKLSNRMVTVAQTPYIGVASYVFITSDADPQEAVTTPEYGAIVSDIPEHFAITENGVINTYYTGLARVYDKDGNPSNVKVCSPVKGNIMDRDVIVKLTDSKVSDLNNETYRLIKVMDTTYSQNTLSNLNSADLNALVYATDPTIVKVVTVGTDTVTAVVGKMTSASASGIEIKGVTPFNMNNQSVRWSLIDNKADGSQFYNVKTGGDAYKNLSDGAIKDKGKLVILYTEGDATKTVNARVIFVNVIAVP